MEDPIRRRMGEELIPNDGEGLLERTLSRGPNARDITLIHVNERFVDG